MAYVETSQAPAGTIYVSRANNLRTRWPGTEGGYPRWRGQDALYFARGTEIWSIDVTLEPELTFGEPRLVAEIGGEFPFYSPYDVDDAGRIVYAKAEYPDVQNPVVVLNWPELLDPTH